MSFASSRREARVCRQRVVSRESPPGENGGGEAMNVRRRVEGSTERQQRRIRRRWMPLLSRRSDRTGAWQSSQRKRAATSVSVPRRRGRTYSTSTEPASNRTKKWRRGAAVGAAISRRFSGTGNGILEKRRISKRATLKSNFAATRSRNSSSAKSLRSSAPAKTKRRSAGCGASERQSHRSRKGRNERDGGGAAKA